MTGLPVQEEHVYPGALKRNQHVLAVMRNSKEWQLAKIVDVRLARGAPPVLDATSMEGVEEERKLQFDYYVHYVGLQRRNDRWASEEDVRLDEEEVADKLAEHERKLKEARETDDFLQNDEHLGLSEKQIHEFEEATKVKTVEFIEFGKHRVESWYFSPFPREYHCATLHICEFCLHFFVHKEELIRHSERCLVRNPPGDEIYRDDSVAVFEVDAKNQQTYCENLCLISKLFLDHKTLYYDIDPFYFYVLCEHDAKGYHMVGYFSREKGNMDNNLSCILVMPFIQRKGYGKFIVEFSYELSLKEGRFGSPEKPLSDLGHRLYVSWWTQRLLSILLECEGKPVSINELSVMTSIDPKDIQYVLENFKILRYHRGTYILFTEPEFLRQILKGQGMPGRPVIRENIHWVPHRDTLGGPQSRQ